MLACARFYGRSKSLAWKSRLAKIRATVDAIKTEGPLPTIVDEDLARHPRYWKQFFRQDEASAVPTSWAERRHV